MSKPLKSILSYTLGAILVFSVVAIAGTLTPGGNTSTPTMYTLSDIYSKIQNINYTASTHTVSTTSSPTAGTFNTLTEIYTLLDDLTYTASDIATGTTIMGIVGNISVPPVDKVEDGYFYGANNALEGTLPARAAPLEWSGFLPPPDSTWTNSVAYCDGLGGGYRLPYVEELIQESPIANPAFSKVGGFDPYNYWTNVSHSDPSGAYAVDMSNGFMSIIIKTEGFGPVARCVR